MHSNIEEEFAGFYDAYVIQCELIIVNGVVSFALVLIINIAMPCYQKYRLITRHLISKLCTPSHFSKNTLEFFIEI